MYSDSEDPDLEDEDNVPITFDPTLDVKAYLAGPTSVASFSMGRRFGSDSERRHATATAADTTEDGFFAVVMAEQYNMPITGGLNRLDVLLTVFSFLPPGTAIVRCAAVCGAWRHVIRAVPQWEPTTTLLQYHGQTHFDGHRVGRGIRTLDAFRENGAMLLRQVASYQDMERLEKRRRCRRARQLPTYIFLHGLWYIGVFLAGLWVALAMASLAQSTVWFDEDLKLGISAAFAEIFLAVVGCLTHAVVMRLRCGAWRWRGRCRLASSRAWPTMAAWLFFLLPPVGTVMSLAAARAYSLELIGATPLWFAGCPTSNASSVLPSPPGAPTSLLPLSLDNIFSYATRQRTKSNATCYSAAPVSTATPHDRGGPSCLYIRNISAWSVEYDEHIGLARGPTSSAALVSFIALVPSDEQRRRCNAQPVLVTSKSPSDDAAYFRKLASGGGSDVLLMTGLPDRFHGAGTEFASLEPLSPGLTYADVRQTATAYYGGEFTYLASTGSEPVRFPSYLAPENVSTANWTLPRSVALWSPAAPASLRIPMAAGRAVPIVDIAGERDRLSAEVVVLFFVSLGIVFLLALPIDWGHYCCIDKPVNACDLSCSNQLSAACCWFGGAIAAPLTLTIAAGTCAWSDSNRCYVRKDVALGLFIAGGTSMSVGLIVLTIFLLARLCDFFNFRIG